MRYYALVTDYDETIARHGRVDDGVIAAFGRLRSSGRKLVLVTGRELDDLLSVFPRPELFERIVAENGALIYRPESREIRLLGTTPPPEFADTLRSRGVKPLSVGHVIVATREPHEMTVLRTIRDIGLELQVIFNKGAVMVLPSGVNKATGLRAALNEIGLSRHNAVGIGDAENDHAFLELCECAVAVSNALPSVRERADLVTRGEAGQGAVELIDRLVATDLEDLEPRLERHHLTLGVRSDGVETKVSPYGVNLLLAGKSGSGKSTLAAGLLERISEQGYQFCIVDPEGDYQSLDQAVVLGDKNTAPTDDEVSRILGRPYQSCVTNLLGIPLEKRPEFFEELLSALVRLRAQTGRPHWIVVDEAHHLLPAARDAAPTVIPNDLAGLLLVTVHPDSVSRTILSTVDYIVATGESPEKALASFSEVIGVGAPPPPSDAQPRGGALVWRRRDGEEPFWIRTLPSKSEQRRHVRKYAEGELGPAESFYFRGPQGKLKLRAQNLLLFLQLADGVDDETWLHHLRRGDYSKWLRTAMKDDALADEIAAIESNGNVSPTETRALVRARIEERYTGRA